MLPAPIVGVSGEDLADSLVEGLKFWVAFEELSDGAVKEPADLGTLPFRVGTESSGAPFTSDARGDIIRSPPLKKGDSGGFVLPVGSKSPRTPLC